MSRVGAVLPGGCPPSVRVHNALFAALSLGVQKKHRWNSCRKSQEEVQVLKEIVAALTGNARLSFTADQRRRLAAAGKALSPEERKKCCQIVKPGTILGWFRQMAARKYNSSESKVGRPRKRKDIRKLVVEMALANLGWGYTRIRDALRTGLKIEIGRTTVANILLEEGIEPAPEREKKRTWKRFMKSHWDTLSACDFFSVEALGAFGTVRYMVFFAIELKSRAVEIAGIAVDPGEEWMKQVARNLTDPVDGFLRGAKYLIHDRDPLFSKAFIAILKAGGVKSVKIPAQSPNCNPYAERFVKTIKYECSQSLCAMTARRGDRDCKSGILEAALLHRR